MAPFYIPINSAQRFIVSKSSLTLVIFKKIAILMDVKGNLMVVLKTPFEIGGKEGRVSEKEEIF